MIRPPTLDRPQAEFSGFAQDDALVDDRIKGPSLHTTEMVAGHEANPSNYLCLTEFEDDVVHKYGLVKLGPMGTNGRAAVADLIEKPKLEDAPSHLASMGRYVSNAEIFNILRMLKPGAGNNIQLTDAIDILAAQNKVAAIEITTRCYDCGPKMGYLTAILVRALDQKRDLRSDRDRLQWHEAEEG